MKKNLLLPILFLLFLGLSCGSKKDAFDTSNFYFKVKIDNQWKNLHDDMGAFLRTEWDGRTNPNVAFGGGNASGKEYMLFNFNIDITRFGTDSLPTTPKMEYNFRYFEYRINDKIVISTPQSGWSDPVGKFSMNEFKVIDTTGKFAGYFKGNMSYVNEQGKTVTITEGQFNFPRNDLK
ncbi:hypothetical protein ACLOAU_22345 [Niabella sp. CJ426]|uniref:hypothetical protein n=1 Tax=Niabella sp. CJ426 TaxID=3393740 RepID=UPI003CFD7D95